MSEKQKRENPSFLFFFAIKARYHFAVTTVVQHPKQISAPAIVEGTPRTIVVLLLCVSVQLYLYSQLRCVRTFRKCSRVFAVQIVADATP